MSYQYFSRNGTILSVKQAVVPLNDIHYSYGFGVYESVRLANGTIFFLEKHCQRLMNSAQIIKLPHTFSTDFVADSIQELIAKNGIKTCNLKILLIGGSTPKDATLYIMCLNPLFPDRALYKRGAIAITYHYEREFPHAKTLNMLPSYLAYRQAQTAEAYDALLVNRQGCITEGTRTNFFTIKDRIITTPKSESILLGVMREAVLGVAQQNGFEIVEQDIRLETISSFDGAFLTSTSSKIMPLRSIDKHAWKNLPTSLLELITKFDDFLNSQANTS